MRFLSSWAAPLVLATRCLAATSNQPILWEDLADLDVFRVDDTWYYSASTMHYSPGAPILQSKDLINWEFIGHSVPVLDWGDNYYLENNSSAYVKGVFASSLRRRPSDGQWFWVGCIEYSRSYIYTASSAEGPWTQLAFFSDQCYYDCGLLFDDDETPYVAYGGGTINVAKLSNDLTSQVSSQEVYTYPDAVEGSRMYKIDGQYYILNIDPSTAIEYVLKSSSPDGSYTQKTLANAPDSPLYTGGGGSPHQGGLVDDTSGNWYYMGFVDAYPGGRVPVLAPVVFNDGYPQLQDINSFPENVETPMTTAVLQLPNHSDIFSGTALSAEWEWNHNPVTSAFSINDGLTLKTATVTSDFFMAQNTLTHRILGPKSSATIAFDYSQMKAGDRAGLAMVRDDSTWIGVIDNGDSKVVGVWSNLALTQQDSGWTTTDTGSLSASTSIASSGTIYLRATADITPGGSNEVQFAYSTDGENFTNMGDVFKMNTNWTFFMGYRYGIFNFATQSLGGSVDVASFDMEYVS